MVWHLAGELRAAINSLASRNSLGAIGWCSAPRTCTTFMSTVTTYSRRLKLSVGRGGRLERDTRPADAREHTHSNSQPFLATTPSAALATPLCNSTRYMGGLRRRVEGLG